jgi:protein TonB
MRSLVGLAMVLVLAGGCATQKPRSPEELQAEQSRLQKEIDRKIAQYQAGRNRAFVSGRNAGKYQPYVSACLSRILEKGNLAYPEEARGRLYGSVRLTFAVHRSGALQAVEIDRTSGHAVLDDALVRAIRSSAPFAPFPAGMDDELDVLSITQTFEFAPDALK